MDKTQELINIIDNLKEVVGININKIRDLQIRVLGLENKIRDKGI